MTPDPTASLDAEQARQRVLDVMAHSDWKTSHYVDVQDVCRIALDAMAERDDLREQLNISETWKRAAAQQPAADDSLRKAAQAFANEPYQTNSARFNGLRNDLRAALAAAPAPRQDDALRELRAWLVWGADISEKHRSYSAKINPVDVLAKIDELLAAKPAPAATTAAPAVGDDSLLTAFLHSQQKHGSGGWLDHGQFALAELCRRELARRNP